MIQPKNYMLQPQIYVMQPKKQNANIEFQADSCKIQAELYKFFDNFELIQPKIHYMIQPKIHYMIQPKNYMLQPQNLRNAAQKAECKHRI